MSSITKTDVGLSNVDNTSDILKPVSTAVSNALALKQDTLTFDTPGSGYSLFTTINGVKHVKGLVASSNITLTPNTDNITIGFNPSGLSLSSGLTTNTISPLDTTANVLSMAGGMNVVGPSTFQNNVTVASDKTLTATTANVLGPLYVGYTTTLNDNVTVASGKKLYIDTLLGAGSAYGVTFDDIVRVGSLASNKQLNVYGPLTNNGNFSVYGNGLINLDLTVNGKSALNDDVTLSAGKTLHVDSIMASTDPTGITLDSDLACTGIISTDLLGSNIASSIEIVDDVAIGSSSSAKTLTVWGTSQFNNNINLASGKSITIGGVPLATSTTTQALQTAKQDVITIKNPAGSVPLMVGTDLYAIKANSPLSIITDSTNGQYVLNADLSTKADLSWVTSQLGNKLSYLAFGNPTGGYPMGSGSNIIYGLTGAGPITLAPNATNSCVDIRFDGTQVSTLAVSGTSTFNNNVTVLIGKT